METTAKEKEFSNSFYYMLLMSCIVLIFLDSIWKFQNTLHNYIPIQFSNVYLIFIRFLYKLFRQSNSLLIPALLLLFTVFACVMSQPKLNLSNSKQQANKYIIIGVLLWIIPIVFRLTHYQIFGFFLNNLLYILSFVFVTRGGIMFHSLVNKHNNDIFNNLNEQFPQNQEYYENEYSVGYNTEFYFEDKKFRGFVPIINPMRAVMVVGSQGSGKTYTVLNPAIWQSLSKGYSAMIYDFKYKDLTLDTFNALNNALKLNKYTYGKNEDGSPILPMFININFQDLKSVHRCNPFNEKYMPTLEDCAQMSKSLMFNLNKSWINKEGDFWAISAVNLLTCALWFLRLVERENKNNSKLQGICTLPHAIQLLNQDPKKIFDIIGRFDELESYSSMFIIALQNQAGSQIAGQIASAQATLAPLFTHNITWVMSGDDIELDVNNPIKPQIVCLGNDPTKSNIHASALSVYTSVIMKKIYNHKKIPCALFVDELPSMYLSGLDDFIATVRSYNVSTWLGIQDFEQLTKSFGKATADVIINTCGSIFCGQVKGSSAEKVSKLFGESMQTLVSTNYSKGDASLNYSQNIRAMLQPSKISTLSQGTMVGMFSDNYNQKVEKKLFHASFDVPEMVRDYNALPVVQKYPNIEDAVKGNYNKIKEDIKYIIEVLSL